MSTLPPHPIDKFQNEMDQNFRNQNELLWQAERTRVKDNQEILAKLETTETGGLHVAAMGVLWLTVGVILSTAAPEIARYFN